MRLCSSCGTRFSQQVAFCPHDGTPTEALKETEQQEDLLIGRVLEARYRIERRIGEGGMGVVYSGRHAVLGKSLAVKVLRPELARDKDVVQRFIHEAQAASSIGHQNIVDISDFGRLEDGSVYFVMEYLDGQPLTSLISKDGSLSGMEAIHIARQIASALSAAHARGIVHRDLKPDNVFLVKQGGQDRVVKVLDFGVAKVGNANVKLTRTGAVFGTPHYMSPEQAAGQGVDQRTDVYALGVILYEMVTGEVPYDADTFMGVLSKHMFSPVPRPSDTVRGRAQDLGGLEDVILKALAKKPEQRQQSMQALIAELETAAAGGRVSVPPDLSQPIVLGSARAVDTAGDLPVVPSRRWPLAVAAAVVLVGVGAVALAVMAEGDPADPDPRVEHVVPDERVVPPDETPGQQPPEPPPVPPPPTPDPPPEPPPEGPMVHVESRPPGAEVLAGGVLVGNTPIDVPRPPEGERRDIEIRLAGFQTKTVTVDATQAELRVRLAPERRRPPGESPPTMVEEPPTPPPPTMEDPGLRPPTEVIDPWSR